MTRDAMIAVLAALDRRLDTRVTVVRVVIAPDGTVIKRIVTGSFMPKHPIDPPSFESLMKQAKGKHHE